MRVRCLSKLFVLVVAQHDKTVLTQIGSFCTFWRRVSWWSPSHKLWFKNVIKSSLNFTVALLADDFGKVALT